MGIGGAVNGTQTRLDVTLTRGGTLQFLRLNGGVRLEYHKADAADPDPRVIMGEVDPRAVLRQLPARKR